MKAGEAEAERRRYVSGPHEHKQDFEDIEQSEKLTASGSLRNMMANQRALKSQLFSIFLSQKSIRDTI